MPDEIRPIAEVKPVAIAQIEAARARLEGLSLPSPLVDCGAAPAAKRVSLKLENLQPIGSFRDPPHRQRRPRKTSGRLEPRNLYHEHGQ